MSFADATGFWNLAMMRFHENQPESKGPLEITRAVAGSSTVTRKSLLYDFLRSLDCHQWQYSIAPHINESNFSLIVIILAFQNNNPDKMFS